MSPAGGTGSQQPLRVMVVGRRAREIERIRAQLADGGIADVVAVGDVNAAVSELGRGPIALAIVDDRVIARDRAGGIQRLAAAAPGLAVVLLTGPRAARAVRDALRAGAADCVTRDELDGTAFARAIARVLEGVLRRRETDWFNADLVTLFSHDLITPLANIMGFASLLVEGKDSQLQDKAGSHIARILANAHYMHELLGSILTTMRIDAGRLALRPAELDAREVAQGVLDRNAFLALDGGIQLEMDAPAGEVSLQADRQKLAQVLDNLVTNAIKYAPSGTRVVVRVIPSAAEVRFEVRDQGPGIPADALPQLFRKFAQVSQTAPRRGRSTGLGLYIVDQLVRLHGGRVAVASTPGEGSTFSVTFPRVAPAPGRPAPARRSSTGRTGSATRGRPSPGAS